MISLLDVVPFCEVGAPNPIVLLKGVVLWEIVDNRLDRIFGGDFLVKRCGDLARYFVYERWFVRGRGQGVVMCEEVPIEEDDGP